jgi:hypothetical protein
MFPVVYSPVQQVKKFRALILFIPSPKNISDRENSFFCSCFFFISSGSSKYKIKFIAKEIKLHKMKKKAENSKTAQTPSLNIADVRRSAFGRLPYNDGKANRQFR